MTLAVFLAVLGAALLHAGWNALIKQGLDKHSAMTILTLGHTVCGLAVVLAFPLPGAEVWPWLIASALIHAAYQLFLTLAYQQGDLSAVYPLARGAAPLIVLAVSAAFLPDRLTLAEGLGVVLLGLGLMVMIGGALRRVAARRMVPFALGAALATAGYTLVDGLGARVWGVPLAYVGWLMLLSGAVYAPMMLAWQGRAVLTPGPRGWALGLVAALASFSAYAIAVWAMTQAPIALVGALREASILFAVVIGWWAFGERVDAARLAGAGLILLGLVVTRL